MRITVFFQFCSFDMVHFGHANAIRQVGECLSHTCIKGPYIIRPTRSWSRQVAIVAPVGTSTELKFSVIYILVQ
jgi:nicotinic acid mononucleotide adenylyltransferase